MRYRCCLALLVVLLGVLGASTAAAQTTTPPASTPTTGAAGTPVASPTAIDAQAVLKRADDVAALAKEAAEQTSRNADLMEKLVWFLGIVVALVGGTFGVFGIKTIRDIRTSMLSTVKESQTTLDEYKTNLESSRAQMKANIQELDAARQLLQTMQQQLDTTQQELNQLGVSVKRQFAATQASLKMMSLGNQRFSEGNYDEAIAAYQRARSLQPNDPEANYRLGRAYSNAGRYGEAIQLLKEALKARPDFAEATMELGLAYRRQADQATRAEERAASYRQAEDYLKRAITLRPDFEDALGVLGGLYRRTRRYQEALQYYGQATLVDPNSSYALSNVASLSWFLDEIDNARRYFVRVEEVASSRILIGREPIYWDLYDRALARLVLGKQAEAVEDYRRAIELTPHAENIGSVLDTMRFLMQAKRPIEGLDQALALIESRLQVH
ncbi:MAG TPA: tetratricopeptide repeat protein [Herpetosiphonaceae bacterium]